MNFRDLPHVPDATKMPFLAKVRWKRRPEGSRAFAAFSPEAVIGDAVEPSVRETAAGCVIVIAIDKRKDWLEPSQVAQVADEVDGVNPHVELHAPLRHGAHEA